MKVTLPNEDKIEAIVWVNPAREMEGCLDDQELAISVQDSDGERESEERFGGEGIR